MILIIQNLYDNAICIVNNVPRIFNYDFLYYYFFNIKGFNIIAYVEADNFIIKKHNDKSIVDFIDCTNFLDFRRHLELFDYISEEGMEYLIMHWENITFIKNNNKFSFIKQEYKTLIREATIKNILI